jgi:hypothetical protein
MVDRSLGDWTRTNGMKKTLAVFAGLMVLGWLGHEYDKAAQSLERRR